MDIKTLFSKGRKITPITLSGSVFDSDIDDTSDYSNIALQRVCYPDIDCGTFPNKKEGIKILILGNSFAQDILSNLANLLRQAGINDVTYGFTFLAGGKIQDYYNLMSSGEVRMHIKENSEDMTGIQITTYSLDYILTLYKWDFVFLQQSRTCNYDYTTYEPYMQPLIEHIKSVVKNPNVCIGFNHVWSGETTESFDGKDRYNKTIMAAKKLSRRYGISVIPPCGTAIQNARKTNIVTSRDWTRDGYHCDLGAGRYVLSATFFQYIFGKLYGVDVRDYKAFRTTEGTPVTDENIEKLNEVAYNAAVVKRYYTEI